MDEKFMKTFNKYFEVWEISTALVRINLELIPAERGSVLVFGKDFLVETPGPPRYNWQIRTICLFQIRTGVAYKDIPYLTSMKFTWKPPFLVSAGQFDLVQTNPTPNEVGNILIFDKSTKASYRSLTDQELLETVSGGFGNLKKNERLSSTPKIQTPDLRDENFNTAKENHNNRGNNSGLKSENKKGSSYLEENIDFHRKISPKTKQVLDVKASPNQKRVGVSAEPSDELKHQIECKDGCCDGSAHSTQNFKLPKYEKEMEAQELIKSAIISNEFLREGLGDKEVMQAVVDAMYSQKMRENSYVIREGEIGAHLYVCAEGLIEVYKNGKKVNTLGPGKIFGELALLCNSRRNATIKAITPCTLWVLDRKVFNQIVKRVGIKRIEEYVQYLRSVPLLRELESDVLKKMTDLLKVAIFSAGTPIIKQGEEGNLFYIITVGTVIVTMANSDGSEETIGKLGKGEFFGEQALIKKDKRTATVTAESQVECLTLDREPFIKFLGGLEEVQQVLESRTAKLRNVKEKSSKYSYIKLEDLEVIGTLGIGGFGRVELVEYRKNRNCTFALKRLKKNHIVAFQQQIHVLNEKSTMLCCQSPFIARLHTTYKDKKYLYFLMEACLGGDVWSLLQKRGFFDEETARFISACVVEALHYLHDRGIVYRDLKPENLLFDSKGYVKLVDFGFAKKLNSAEKTWTFAGTPEYLAPEIVLNKGHDRAVDYWALGVFIYELLVGKSPFRGADQMDTYQLILKGMSSMTFPKFVSKSAELLVKKLCKVEPTERLGYQKEGINGIKYHKWFAEFNWVALEKTEMRAPFVPQISGPTDLSYFEECPKDKEIPPDEFGDWDTDF